MVNSVNWLKPYSQIEAEGMQASAQANQPTFLEQQMSSGMTGLLSERMDSFEVHKNDYEKEFPLALISGKAIIDDEGNKLVYRAFEDYGRTSTPYEGSNFKHVSEETGISIPKLKRDNQDYDTGRILAIPENEMGVLCINGEDEYQIEILPVEYGKTVSDYRKEYNLPREAMDAIALCNPHIEDLGNVRAGTLLNMPLEKLQSHMVEGAVPYYDIEVKETSAQEAPAPKNTVAYDNTPEENFNLLTINQNPELNRMYQDGNNFAFECNELTKFGVIKEILGLENEDFINMYGINAKGVDSNFHPLFAPDDYTFPIGTKVEISASALPPMADTIDIMDSYPYGISPENTAEENAYILTKNNQLEGGNTGSPQLYKEKALGFLWDTGNYIFECKGSSASMEYICQSLNLPAGKIKVDGDYYNNGNGTVLEAGTKLIIPEQYLPKMDKYAVISN